MQSSNLRENSPFSSNFTSPQFNLRCQAIKQSFEDAFRDTKDAVAELPHNRSFDVDELAIFGKLQLFGSRQSQRSVK